MTHVAILVGGPFDTDMIQTEGERELWLPVSPEHEFAIYIRGESVAAGHFMNMESYHYSRNYVRPEGVPIGEHHGPS